MQKVKDIVYLSPDGGTEIPSAKGFPDKRQQEDSLGHLDISVSATGLADFFPPKFVRAMQANLKSKGLSVKRFRLTGKEHNISWSERVHARINALDARGNVLESYFVLKPIDEREVEDTVRMSNAGCAVEIVKGEDGRAVKTAEDRILIKMYPMENRLHRAWRNMRSESIAATYGRKMADMALTCIKEGVLYDFEGQGAIAATTKHKTRQQKGRNALMNCILDGVGENMENHQNMRPILVDWSNAVHLEDLEQDEQRVQIAKFLSNSIKLIYTSTTNILGARSLWEFTSKVGLEREGTVSDLVMSILQGAGGVPYSELVRDAWGSLCGDGKVERTEQEIHWGRVREYMRKASSGITEMVRDIPDEWENQVLQIVDRSQGEVDRTSAALVVRHMVEVGCVDLSMTRINYNHRTNRIEVYVGGKGSKVFSRYAVNSVSSASEYDSLRPVWENQISENVVAADSRRNQLITTEVPRRQHLRIAGKTMSPEQSILMAESVSRLLNNMIDNNIQFDPVDYKKIGYVEFSPGATRFRLAFINEPRRGNISTDEELKPETVKKHIKSIASLFLNQVSCGAEAWKSFETSFPGYAPSEMQREANIRLLTEAKDELEAETASTGRYGRFFEKARSVLAVKDSPRETHMKWVEYRTAQKPSFHFHTKTLESLRSLEGLMTETVNILQHMDGIHDSVLDRMIALSIQDVVPDISSIRICLRGDHNKLLEDAVDGSLSFKKGAMVVRLFRHEMKQPYADFHSKYAVFEFDETGLKKPQLVDFNGLKEYFKPTAFRVLLTPTRDRGTATTTLPASQRYGFTYLTQFFSDKPDLLHPDPRRLEIIESVADAETLAQEVYGNQGARIVHTLAENAYGLPPDKRDDIERNVREIVDPRFPEFLDGRFDHYPFALYGTIPEVLNAKIQTSYRNLDHRLEQLFTLENAIETVQRHEEEIGRRLHEKEQVALLQQLEEAGDIRRVRLKGDKPSEYIKDIRYLRDGNHYVIQITVETEEGPRSAIVKRTEPRLKGGITSNLMVELVPSSILMLIRKEGKPIARTPMVVSLDKEYGVESIAKGMPIDQTPEELRIKHQEMIAYQLGVYSRISNITGDGHPGNTLLAEDGEVTRIDLEISKRWRADSSKTLDYYINVFGLDVLRTQIPTWNQNRSLLWKQFLDGMRHADLELKKPEAQKEIHRMIRVLKKNYPPERTGLTPDFIRDINETINLPLDTIVQSLINRQIDIWKSYSKDWENQPFDPQHKFIQAELRFWERV